MRNISIHFLFVMFVTLVTTRGASACIWDTDTLAQEMSRFPTVRELIAGKFLRHSVPFYQWRATDRQRRIDAGTATEGDYDDLAVAFDKLGRHEDAIRLMTERLAIDPTRYETVANLGTFYIHAGNFEEGKKFIQQAIEINPDAHFGREKYQLLLVEYVQSRRGESGEIPTPLSEWKNSYQYSGFAEWVLDHQLPAVEPGQQGENYSQTKQRQQEELQRAIQGVLGMMRFGKHDSPILLEALGDLLVGRIEVDARHLSARTYLRAADIVQDPEAKTKYRERAKSVIAPHESVELEQVEARLREEIKEANQWYADLEQQEQAWTSPDSKLDPEKQFNTLYANPPELSRTDTEVWTGVALDPASAKSLDLRHYLQAAVVLAVIIALAAWYFRHRKATPVP
ncbi:MAG: tetratricopeptide repeat protein [Planctomycetaceae bacterium]